jgi:uncharacterized membrane protein YccC
MEMSWSRWFRCESSFELLLVPKQPGVFAVAEEVVEPASPGSRRMLAVFAVDETEDLARALSRMFATGSPWQQKLHESVCYVRYAVTAEEEKRHAAANALRHWLDSKREVAGQVFATAPAVSEPQVAAAQVAMAAAVSDVAEADQSDDDEDDGTVKTTAERAVDRVARGAGYAGVFKVTGK